MVLNKWWEQDDEKNSEWQALKTPEGLTYYYNVRTNVTQWVCPDELKTKDDMSKAGEWIWIPHPTDAYIPAKIVSRTGKKVTAQSEDGKTYTVKSSEIFSLEWSSLQRIVSDLTLLDDINAPLILHNLKKRFEKDKIYTNLGTILISVNPFFRLPLYGPDVIRDYQEKGLREMPPHVFNIADNALKGILDGPDNQSIIVSGESGAGKTEATKQCLSYLASNAGSIDGVEQKILLSNPILEAFGNAKTIRNNNSSRFGKYIEVNFNDDKEINGSVTTNFLLEKVRVVKPAVSERNFHIFYQLTKAAPSDLRRDLHIGKPNDYKFITDSQCIDVEGVDDCREFEEMLVAMNELGFSKLDQKWIFQTVSAILHLGNITFTNTGDRKCRAENPQSVKIAAKLLGIKESDLQYSLVNRTLRIRGQENTSVGLDAAQACESRDALAKFAYGNMFDWIVKKVNASMTPPSRGNNRTIGILDIFGFEIFEWNSFEQLCINYTNEKLQQFFNANTFKLEEQVYASEGIDFKHVDFVDNQPVLDLIEGKNPPGLLKLLDEQVVMPRGSDAKFLTCATEQHPGSSLFGPDRTYPNHFVISHYAGQVLYDTCGFIDKNRDTLTEDALGLLHSSTFEFIPQIFPSLDQVSSKDRKRTLGFQFRKQLDELMKALYETEPHYIRCIKPNDNKRAKEFISKSVYEQLTYSGVFEAVKIRKTGFPFRQVHAKFLERYGVITSKQYGSGKSACQNLVNDLKLDPQNVRMGRTMVLYRADEYKNMELQRSIVIQKVELVDQVKKLLLKDVSTMENPDVHYEKLSKAVKKARLFKISHECIEQARDLIYDYVESRIDPQVKDMLENARDTMNVAMLEEGMAIVDREGYETQLCKECRILLDRIHRIQEEAISANYALQEKHMNVVISAADEIGLYDEYVEYFRQLLYQTGTQQLLKILIQKSKEIGDEARAIRLTIRIKDSIFEQQASLFTFKNFGQLKSSEDWAGEKFLTLSRDSLKEGMLFHSKDSIHTALTQLPKEKNKLAQQLFQWIQCFMKDRKSEDSDSDGEQVVQTGLADSKMRDEIYCQLIKQLTHNMNPHSVERGWTLLGACIATFPPSESFENYLEVFLKTKAPSTDYVGALQNVTYYGARNMIVGKYQFPQIKTILWQRTDEYSEKLPPGLPPWSDLEEPFDPYPGDVEFARTAPRPEKTSKPKLSSLAEATFANKSATVWHEYYDENSQAYYYWNELTNESTWEKPAELKYALTTGPGVRI